MDDKTQEEQKQETEQEIQARKVRGEIKEKVQAFCTNMQEEYGLKITIAAFHGSDNQVGMWQSENVTYIDELGFSKLYQSQY